jgi:hypothetical protein
MALQEILEFEFGGVSVVAFDNILGIQNIQKYMNIKLVSRCSLGRNKDMQRFVYSLD